ncbi:uncharacterized protein BKA78DRAFT_358465 [Phyllosticta capitalensis]|uniref:uncharacterized protein n=1 Tax=Phyllosticta capitalensis TaxID=121624 RepID=UPI00312EC006
MAYTKIDSPVEEKFNDVRSAPYGQRLMTSLIDSYAEHEPDRVYASIPINDDDLSQGYRDISFFQFAAAINRAAHWLDSTLGKVDRKPGDPFDTFAYTGPRDLRYPILVVAASKVGRRVVMPSLLASVEAQVHIANVARCTTFICGADYPFIPAVANQIPGSKIIKAPSWEELLAEPDSAPRYPYTKSFEEAKNDEIFIFHTSGSTGLPKVYTTTQGMQARIDKTNEFKNDKPRIVVDMEPGSRIYCSIPVFHSAGMNLALSSTLHFGQIFVYGPSKGPVSREAAIEVYKYGKLDGGVHPPFLIEDMLRDPVGRDLLSKIKYAMFGGAPLSKAAGDTLASFGNAFPAMGSTEGSVWITHAPVDQRDWQYYSFHRVMSVEFEHHVGPYHELIIKRTPLSEAYTVFFDAVPSAKDEFRTKDLYSRHPDPAKSHLWKYEGRTDDLVVLSGEVKMYAATLEEQLRSVPGVKHALVGGQQRPVPFLLIEPVDEPQTEEQAQKLLSNIWPAIEEHNRNVLETTQLRWQLAMVAPKDRPFVRSGKGSVDRRNTFKEFEKEIAQLYEQAGFK